MPITRRDDLEGLSRDELAQLVRELRAAHEQLGGGYAQPPSAAQSLLDDQLRRTSLLTQLAIEFRESLDPHTIVEQTLRAIVVHLVVAGASIVLVGAGGAIELACTVVDGAVQQMAPDLARDVIARGLAGWVVRHGSSVALSDVARDRRWLQFSEQHRTGSVIVIPVRQSSATLGVLTVHRVLPYAFSSHDLILLEGVAAQLGVALSAARHQASERQRRDQAMALLTMSQFLTAERTPAEVAAMLQEKSVLVFGAKAGLLFLVDDEHVLRPITPEIGAGRDPALIRMATGAAELAWAGQRIATTAPAPELTAVALPLTHHGATIGAFALLHANSGGFSAAIWSLLTVFTHVIAAACANITLVGRLKDQARTLEGLVEQRTRQVQRSRDTLRTVFDSLSEGVLLIDAGERVAAANSHFCALVANTHPRALVGKSYAELWRDLERGGLRVDLAQGAEVGRQRLLVRRGERRFVVERAPIGDGNGPEQALEFWREER
jgi:transcriptional regulator with GAF, ATPase, and Fis domain